MHELQVYEYKVLTFVHAELYDYMTGKHFKLCVL